MGDSYSSGEGNRPFDDGTDLFNFGRRLNGCHRSDAAWPRQLGAPIDWHLACSGAVIRDLYAGQERLPPDSVGQLRRLDAIQSQLEQSGRTLNRVSLTIGGNDDQVGFAAILGDCFFRECLARFDQNLARIATFERPLTRLLQQIGDTAPDATVILVGYPRLFPAQQSSNVACGWLTPRERIRANTLQAELDLVLRRAANAAGATFVSVANALDGHELCTADSWMFEVNPLLYGVDQRQGHPLFAGQIAIADIVRPYILP
jgi:hypothetical protein